MEEKIKTSFWLYRSKMNSKGLVPIYLRITNNIAKTEISTGVTVLPKQWDSKRGRVKGQSEETNGMNEILKAFIAKIYKITSQAIVNEKPLTIDEIKQQLSGTKSESGLVHYFEKHIERMKSLIGIDYSDGSVELYERTMKNFQDFILQTTKQPDILLSQLNYKTAQDFSDFLKTKKINTTNTVIKKLQRLNCVVNDLVRRGALQRNPFSEFKLKKEQKEIIYLTTEELQRIETKSFNIKRLEIVKDMFVFSCYCGLAYKEVENLRTENIRQDNTSTNWIIIERQKTGIPMEVPILPKTQLILDRYREEHENSYIFPRISNQKLNAYLKEIADCCKIKKNLTFHMARKTFATTVTLSKGVSLESISKMLGHSNIRITTSHYAVTNHEKLLRELRDIN